MVHTVQHAGPSTEAMLPFSPQSPRSALPALPSHVQAIHDFDPTLLAFTSNGNPNMYLSFSAGDILKVHVRDQTGWWDGEVASAPQPGDGDGRKGPRRGWFPSNYVRDMGWEALPHRKNNSNASGASSARRSPSDINHSVSSVHTRQTSSALSQQTRASTPNSASPTHSHFGQRVRQASNPLPQSPNGVSLSPSLQALLHPIVQALSLLETTIHANRKTHIQPSTACVISAIRAALQQTDCLSKESPVLARHNVLSKERKMVLVELSKLVACARTASGVGDDGTTIERSEEEDDREMEALARAARGVFGGVKRFLQLAGNCGVEAIPLPDEDGDSSNGLATPTAASPRPGGLRVRTTSSGNTRIQETFKKKAASIGDLRATKRRQSSPPPPMPATAALDVDRAAQTSRSRSPSITTPISATFTATSGSGPPSPVSIKSGRGRRIQGSIDSSFSHHTTASSDGGHGQETSFESQDVTPVPTPPAAIIDKRLGHSPLDFTERVGSAEDALLSIIAAFIGHIHSHHLGSHPSSHATLVEMTRQTIDAVRDLLTIVEEIGHNIRLRSIRPRDLDSLRVAKDQLYDVASRLVESAEAVANALPDSGDEGYDKDKNQLLQSATGTLRAGTECVRLVRLCSPELSTLLSTPKQSINAARHHTPRPNQEAALIKRDYPVGQRGEHTLSGLHRKATSLSYLSKRYQQDGGMVHGPVEEDEQAQLEDDEDEEIVADTSREEDVTVKPMAIDSLPESSHLTREPTVRPSLVHMHTAPLGIPPAAKSAGLQQTHSEGPTLAPRSRSSSLSSPAPPRLQRRSPSRSADLDQHTGEYDIPIRPKPQPATISSAPAHRTSVMTAFSQSSVSTRASGSTALTSTRSSGGSFSHTSRPQTPHLQDSPQLGSFKVDFSPDLSLPKLSQLKIDTGRDVTVPRPQPHSAVVPRPPAIRTVTSPVQAQPDMRFWVSAHDYDPREITFNSDGNMVGASLAVLVEKMTPHDGPVDLTFWSSFFYTFRLHTSPPNLLEALIRRYDITPPSNVMMTEREVEVWVERKVVPVRLRVYNLLKSWLDTFWKSEADDVVLDTLKTFVTTTMQRTLPAMAPRLQESIRKRASGPPSAGLDRPPSSASSYGERKNHSRTMSSDKLSLRSHLSVLSPTVSTPSPSPTGLNPMSQLPPTPVISKSLHTLLQKPNVELSRIPLTEFDTLELARQMTIMESKMFNQVAPEDLLLTGRRKVDGLKALSETSNQITGWVADSILAEMDIKRRTALLKFYIKLADKCLSLHNFSSMWAILAGLNSSTIMRLKKTWDALSSKSTKYRLMMDRLRAVIEHTKNHAAYRARLREVTGPCLPFLGLILTDITFTFDGNPDTRQSTLAPDLSLVNHDKYAKLGKIAVEFKRYQEPFNFHALEAVQAYLKRVLAERGSSSIDALYRKSLLLEPRQGQERVSTFIERPGWLGGRI